MSLNWIIIIFLTLVSGCSSSNSEAPLPPEKTNLERASAANPPVIQLRQTLNFAPSQTFSAALNALSSFGIGSLVANKSEGIIESDWIKVTDRQCSGQKTYNTPLNCRAQLLIKIEPFHLNASALNMRYAEFCSVNEEIPISCANSVGERLMISVSENIRRADESSSD